MSYLAYSDLYNLFLTGEAQLRCTMTHSALFLVVNRDSFSKFPCTALGMRHLRELTITCSSSEWFGPFTFTSDVFPKYGPCLSLEKLCIRFWQSFEVLHPAAQLSWCCPNLKHLELVGSTVTLRESMLWDLPAGIQVLILKNLGCFRVGHLLEAASVLPLLPKNLYHLELPTLDTTLVELETEDESVLPRNLRILRLENLNESRILLHLPSKLEECYFSLSSLMATSAPSEIHASTLPLSLRVLCEEPLLGLVVLDVDEPLPPDMETLSVQVNLNPSIKRLHQVFPSSLRRLPSNITIPSHNHHEDVDFGDLFLDYAKFPNLRSIDTTKFEKKTAPNLLCKLWSSCRHLTALNLGSHRLDRIKAFLQNDDYPNSHMDVDTDETFTRLGLSHLPSSLKNLALTIADIDTFREIPRQLEKLSILGSGTTDANFLHGCTWTCFLPPKLTWLKIPQEFITDPSTVNSVLTTCANLKIFDCGLHENILRDPKLFSLNNKAHPLQKLFILSLGVELDEFSWFENLSHFSESLLELTLDIQGSHVFRLTKHLELLPKSLKRLTMNLRATFETNALSKLPKSLFGLKLSISCPPDKSTITLSNEHFANLPQKLYFLKVDVRGVSRLTKHVVSLLPPDIHYMNITTHDREQRPLLLAIRRYYESNPKKWAGYVPPHLTPGLLPLRCCFPPEY